MHSRPNSSYTCCAICATVSHFQTGAAVRIVVCGDNVYRISCEPRKFITYLSWVQLPELIRKKNGTHMIRNHGDRVPEYLQFGMVSFQNRQGNSHERPGDSASRGLRFRGIKVRQFCSLKSPCGDKYKVISFDENNHRLGYLNENKIGKAYIDL